MTQLFSRYRCALNFKIGPKALRQRVTITKPICLIAIAAVSVLTVNSSEASGQVQERARWLLPDVAKVTLDSSGQSQIDFNPAICRRLGPELCEYFRAHEYGHVNLRHLERGVPTRQAEREADLWAARNASPSAVEAARKYFSKGRGGSLQHGSARERAQRLSEFQTTQQPATTVQQRVTVLKPSVTANTTAATVRNPTQYSGGSRNTVTRQPTITYLTRSGAANTAAVATRAPTEYSGGSRKTVVLKVVPYRAKKVIYSVKPAVSAAPSYASQGYIPKGDFNNPR